MNIKNDVEHDIEKDFDHDVEHDIEKDFDHDVEHDIEKDFDHDVEHDVEKDFDHGAEHDVDVDHGHLLLDRCDLLIDRARPSGCFRGEGRARGAGARVARGASGGPDP